ncbi:hypothetical protein BDV34DRAFT_200617 [Aspergillus parasiticus]|uniref:Rhodopsin domain-containing protein n=1 Tax=Aspergillus parasiticus TaxID=5067 RepID=A0A5N6DBM7_ASPPA|nr:hypothetical protein BDV34DRAFT_200617 [Aspergillus parasiticus]
MVTLSIIPFAIQNTSIVKFLADCFHILVPCTAASMSSRVLFSKELRLPVKTGLCVLMGLGVIACICSIVKTTYLRVLSKTENVTYYLSQLITWNETEMWVILIVGCIPPIRPLLMIIFHKILTSARSATWRYNKQSRDGTELQSYTRPFKHAPKAPKPHPHGTDLSTVNGKGSEENILSVEDGAIVKTTDISLTYEVPAGSREQGEPYRQVLPHEKI